MKVFERRTESKNKRNNFLNQGETSSLPYDQKYQRSHLQDSGNLFPLQKTLKIKNCEKCFSKNFLFVGVSHSAEKTKSGQLLQKL